MTQKNPSGDGAAGQPQRLRILMAHWNGSGNVPPQRALARELARRGHEVHVLTHDTLAGAVAADGGRFHALSKAAQWNPAEARSMEAEAAFLAQNVVGSPAYAADFLAVHEAVRPDLSLIDCMLATTVSLAIERRWPFAAVDHLCWLEDGVCTGFLDSMVTPATGSTLYDLMNRAPMVLATSYRVFGGPGEIAPHVHFVGPIRERAAGVPWTRRFPDRPFILVSLSQAHQGQGATLRNICQALSVLPVEALVTTGGSFAPEDLPISGGVEARAFVPHDAVLPLADLVITHAGFGTLQYSVGSGAPVLCLPNGRDQNDNAARVEALGLGRVLSPDAPPAEIGQAVMDMLGDTTLRSASRSFATGVPRFGDLARAAGLAEQLALADELAPAVG